MPQDSCEERWFTEAQDGFWENGAAAVSYTHLAVYDMWENEEATGDPGNSLYLRGDEIE